MMTRRLRPVTSATASVPKCPMIWSSADPTIGSAQSCSRRLSRISSASWLKHGAAVLVGPSVRSGSCRSRRQRFSSAAPGRRPSRYRHQKLARGKLDVEVGALFDGQRGKCPVEHRLGRRDELDHDALAAGEIGARSRERARAASCRSGVGRRTAAWWIRRSTVRPPWRRCYRCHSRSCPSHGSRPGRRAGCCG